MKYSQNDEQFVIAEYFTEHGTRNNRFLDIGANDGTLFSNSRALADVGWHGVLVEPSPRPFSALLDLYGGRHGIVLIHAAIAEKAGLAVFHDAAGDLEGSLVGSLDPLHVVKWSMDAKFRPFLLPTITPEMLVNLVGTHFDFVNVDVEGQSAELFRLLVHAGVTARCWCVEHDGQTDEILQLAEPTGLAKLDWNQENVLLGIVPQEITAPDSP